MIVLLFVLGFFSLSTISNGLYWCTGYWLFHACQSGPCQQRMGEQLNQCAAKGLIIHYKFYLMWAFFNGKNCVP